MRLLFLTPQIPYPPHKGTTIRNYHLIAGLAARHTIDLLTFADADQSGVDVDAPLNALCRRIAVLPAPQRSMPQRALNTLFSRWPDMGLRLWSASFVDRLRAWLRDGAYDVVQSEGIEMARYGMLARGESRTLRWVMDDHNAEWLLQQRTYRAERELSGWSAGAIYSLIQTMKLRRFERRLCRAADRVLAVSQADVAALHELDPHLPIDVVTNGVDTSFNDPRAVAAMNFDAPTLVFSGTMDFRPNVDAVLWFVDHVWPRIRAAKPATRFIIVGQRPHARLDRVRGIEGIQITGAVDDVRPYLLGATTCIVPLRMGGGTRLKVLDAMSLARAVVSTSMGVDGFDVQHGRELLIADSAEAFTAAVLQLTADRAQCAALGERARQFVEAAYDWKTIVPKLEQVYRNVRALS
jgi:sugar transferase (PEP-CTERM/EpsH1 system associated)